ncbi:MAG: Lrp/AsnC family transcriptional regulator [archaeon]
MSRKGPGEQDMLQFVMKTGDDGILQSELWKKMKADSREGSRAILRLERKGLIARKKELHNGRWTYRVFSKRKLSKIDSVEFIPCTFCDDEPRCGQSAIVTPDRCLKLTQWLLGPEMIRPS